MLLLVAGVAAAASCSGGGTRMVMEVAETRAPCIGMAPQECLLVRRSAGADWEFMYQGIEGFTFEPGFRYRLTVSRHRVPNPPMDASSVRYRLVRVQERTPSAVSDLLARVAAAEALWESAAPHAYTMVVQRGCFCGFETVGPVRLQVVRDEGPVLWERLTAQPVYAADGRTVPSEYLDFFPSVARLFQLLRVMAVSDLQRIEVDFDETLGYPRRLFIDRSAAVADDEVEYTVVSLE